MDNANIRFLRFIQTLSNNDLEVIGNYEDILYNSNLIIEKLDKVSLFYCNDCNHITIMYDYEIYKNISDLTCSYCGGSNKDNIVYLEYVGDIEIRFNRFTPSETFKKVMTYNHLANKATNSENKYKCIYKKAYGFPPELEKEEKDQREKEREAAIEQLKKVYTNYSIDQIFDVFLETIEELNDYYKFEGKIGDMLLSDDDNAYCLKATPQEIKELMLQRLAEKIKAKKQEV